MDSNDIKSVRGHKEIKSIRGHDFCHPNVSVGRQLCVIMCNRNILWLDSNAIKSVRGHKEIKSIRGHDFFHPNVRCRGLGSYTYDYVSVTEAG